jgi:hypothetical protein
VGYFNRLLSPDVSWAARNANSPERRFSIGFPADDAKSRLKIGVLKPKL